MENVQAPGPSGVTVKRPDVVEAGPIEATVVPVPLESVHDAGLAMKAPK
jgi:hypothetical protein